MKHAVVKRSTNDFPDSQIQELLDLHGITEAARILNVWSNCILRLIKLGRIVDSPDSAYYNAPRIESLPNEIWAAVPGFEGFYEVSNMGRIKSLKRDVVQGTRGGGTTIKRVPEKIREPFPTPIGRACIRLWDHGRSKIFNLSRLVLSVHGREPLEGEVCMHLNHTPMDNRVENLQWGTQAENMQMDWREGRRKAYSHWAGKINEKHPLSKPIIQKSLSGEVIAEFPNASEAERQLGFQARTIRRCCNGELQKSRGFVWEFKQAS